MKINRSKYLKKIIYFSLIVGTLPVMILGLFSYLKSSNAIQTKVNEANLQGLLQSESRTEEVLKYINNYYIIMANSSSIYNYLDKDLDPSDYQNIHDFQLSLSGIRGAGSSVRNAYLINLKKDWVLGTDGIHSVSDIVSRDKFTQFLDKNKNCSWIYNKEYSMFNVDNTTNNDNNSLSDNSSTVSKSGSTNPLDDTYMIIKLPLNSDKPTGAIVVNLLGYDFYNNAVKSNRTEEMVLLDNNYSILESDGNTIINVNKDKNIFVSELKKHAGDKGYFTTNINGKKIGICYKKSEYNNWIYTYVYSISDITKDSRSIGIVTALLCVFSLLCVCVLSFYGSKRIYNPIKGIYDIIKNSTDVEDNDASSDEVKLIDEGISVLFKGQSQMMEQINVQWLQLEELFLIRLINGEIDNNEIERKTQNFYNPNLWKQLSIITIQIDSFDGTEYSEKDREVLMLSINRIICDVVSAGFRLQPTLINKVQVVLLGENLEDNEKFKEYVYKVAQEIQEKIKNDLKLGVSIGISRAYNEINHTQIAYKESMEALMCKFKFGEQSILCYEDVQPNSSIKQVYPKNFEQELIDSINQGDIEKSKMNLGKIIDEMHKEELGLSEYQLYLSRLFISIIGILQDSGESINTILNNKSRLLNELFELNHSKQVKNWFMNSLIKPIIEILEERRGSQYKNILDKVLNMIHEEYDTDLSLEVCADRLNYHSSYIWRVLKKEMNITFSDYLAQYRLKISKKWLEETDMPVSEIAEKLRYNNSQNFIRYFKKLEGVTPGQYRQSYKASIS